MTEATRRMWAWIGGGTSLLLILAVGVVAFWPASETEQARADGEAFGTAVVALQEASTPEEVDAALVDLHDAAAETADHAGDELAEQVDDQADALDRAVDGFVGERSTTDDFEQELYALELEDAVNDLTSNAEEFRTQGPEVRTAFWDGYQDALAA